MGPVAVALAALGAPGCGGDRPHLARADVAPLVALSRQIATEGRCAQARDIRLLQSRTIALVNARRVPAELQETLLGGVNELASRTPVCVPRVAPVAIEPVDPAITVRGRGHDKENRKHHGHGHGHGEGEGD